ncbi:MAG: metallophosphoesterase [Candidatus Schekmanbacteria bacterium]|nr:metallophosphoesterase [Candidatus Schekmanbacteria bacterium]
MSYLTWLHLSDLCFGSSQLQEGSDGCYVRLLDDLSKYSIKNNLSVDFIVFTGDLVFSGQVIEYQTAAWFFDQLLKILHLPKNRLFIVPGDRDLEYEKINHCILPDLSTTDKINEFLGNREAKEIHFKKFSNYKNFVNQYFAHVLEFDFNDRYFWVRKFNLNGVEIGLMGLNNTWNVQNHHDTENIMLGKQQLDSALALMGKVDLCLAAFHHPLESITESDCVRKTLENNCHFILHGHYYQKQLPQTADSPLVVSAGAGEKENQYSGAYNFVQVDSGQQKAVFHFRRFSEAEKEWKPDNERCTTNKSINFLDLILGEPPPKILPLALSPPKTAIPPKNFTLPVHFAHSVTLEEYWVERLNEIRLLNAHYHEKETKVLGLIGASGTGKTALVRHWLERTSADGVFYWNFQYEPSVDAFLFAALKYLSSGGFRPENAPSCAARLAILMSYLKQGRFILVLDSLDELLEAEKERACFGKAGDYDFIDLLNRLAGEAHQSFILLTSRRQIKDLLVFEGQNYRRLILGGLTPAEADDLFRKYKIEGSAEAIDKIAFEYHYHPLSLKLIAAYLQKYYSGQIKYSYKFPPKKTDSENQIDSILAVYEDKLSPTKRVFMSIMACFNRSLEEEALFSVFCRPMDDFDNSVLVDLNLFNFQQMLRDLGKTGLIVLDQKEDTFIYSVHPLLRSYYYLDLPLSARNCIHQQIARYYERQVYRPPQTIADLTSAIEAFQHTIDANQYRRAFGIYLNKINMPNATGNRFLSQQLGAYELDLKLLSHFFPNRDIQQEALLGANEERSWLASAIGYRLMMLGHLTDAVNFLQRGIQMDTAVGNWKNASIDSQNLSCVYLLLGELVKAEETANDALLWAQYAEDKTQAAGILEFSAYPSFLQGKNKEAGELFEKANITKKARERAGEGGAAVLPGMYYAEYLYRNGRENLAEEITLTNLEICQAKKWTNNMVRCFRLLAGFSLGRQEYQQTENYLQDGLHIARQLGLHEELANITLGFGRLLLARNKFPEAKTTLGNALKISRRCGYKLIEINTHNTLARVHQTDHKPQSAYDEAEAALKLSRTCGYYWGQMDAQSLLTHPDA